MTQMGQGQLLERNGLDIQVGQMNRYPGQTSGPRPVTRENWAGYMGWPDELVGRMNWYPGQMGGLRLDTGVQWARYMIWPDEWVPKANGWAEASYQRGMSWIYGLARWMGTQGKQVGRGYSGWAGYMVWLDELVPRQTGGLRVVDGPDIWVGWMDVFTPGKQVGWRNVYAQPTQMG
ncbi:hypothetical protein BDR06DRAFT_971124 [Suillus hirtellus]|nr:hypothetical protein BDR06DRAFT_971124 [Suillus hirtellus]